jgi:hypothetical protein
MSLMQIPVVKGKANVEIETDNLPDEVYQEALRLGLKELVNRGMSKITVAKLEGEKLAEAQAAAMAKAQENVESIKAGKIRFSGQKSSVKASGAVMTEARRIAKNIVKDTLKAAGHKISHYAAKDITAAANALIEAQPEIVKTAEENLKKRAEAPVKIDITSLIKESPKLVAKAEAEKAEKKAQLSAKQAGMVAKRQKGEARLTSH